MLTYYKPKQILTRLQRSGSLTLSSGGVRKTVCTKITSRFQGNSVQFWVFINQFDTISKVSFESNLKFIRILEANWFISSYVIKTVVVLFPRYWRTKKAKGPFQANTALLVGFRRCVFAYLTQRHEKVPF